MVCRGDVVISLCDCRTNLSPTKQLTKLNVIVSEAYIFNPLPVQNLCKF